MESTRSPNIGTLNEKPLHEALKKWYACPRDKFEVPVDGFIIDIKRGRLLVEIQTRNLSAIRNKLEKLLDNHKVRLVYPVACEKWIIRQPQNQGDKVTRRKSPKRGDFQEVFNELIRIPRLIANPNFSLELLLIEEEEVRRYDGIRGWRRRYWVTDERRLLTVIGRKIMHTPADLSAFIPAGLAEPFTTSDLAIAIGRTPGFARRMVYCLKAAGCITAVGKKANSLLYARLPVEVMPPLK